VWNTGAALTVQVTGSGAGRGWLTSSAGKILARRSKMPMMPSISAMGTGKYLGGSPVSLAAAAAGGVHVEVFEQGWAIMNDRDMLLAHSQAKNSSSKHVIAAMKPCCSYSMQALQKQ
jgi:hypothetical protein